MKKILIAGREYPFHVTMGALLRFKRETGHDVSEMASGSISEMAVLLWCCTASACNAERIAFDIPLLDFADALSPDVLEEFVSGFAGTGQKKSLTAAKG